MASLTLIVLTLCALTPFPLTRAQPTRQDGARRPLRDLNGPLNLNIAFEDQQDATQEQVNNLNAFSEMQSAQITALNTMLDQSNACMMSLMQELLHPGAAFDHVQFQSVCYHVLSHLQQVVTIHPTSANAMQTAIEVNNMIDNHNAHANAMLNEWFGVDVESSGSDDESSVMSGPPTPDYPPGFDINANAGNTPFHTNDIPDTPASPNVDDVTGPSYMHDIPVDYIPDVVGGSPPVDPRLLHGPGDVAGPSYVAESPPAYDGPGDPAGPSYVPCPRV